MKSDSFKGYLYVLISAAGFSIVPLLAKYTLDAGMNSETVLTYRFIIAGLFFILYSLYNRQSLIVDKTTAIKLVGIGLLYALESAIFFEAFKYISPGMGQLLFQINPIMVAIAAFFVFKEKLSFNVITALLLVVVGCGLLFWEPSTFVTPFGVFLVILAAIFYTTYVIVGKDILSTVEPIVVTTYLTVSCGLFLTFYSFLTSNFLAITSTNVAIAIAILGIFSTIISILAFSIGLKLLDASVASILCALEPVITVGLAYIIFGDTLNTIQIIGAILIILSMIVIDLKPKSKSDATGDLDSI